MKRRNFLSLSCLAAASCCTAPAFFALAGNSGPSELIMTVRGKLKSKGLGLFLPHEHVLTDFIGAEKVIQPQYNRSEAFRRMLPFLLEAKKSGVHVIAECTPAYIGRDVRLLKMLSEASGIEIITNTGYYAAAGLKYLPRHAYTESSSALAARWLKEWEIGIEDTGIRPGFIKLGVDGKPLKEVEKKLVRAAALTHLKSGLKIAIHNGNATALVEEVAILAEAGVHPNAMIWVHAQNDSDGQRQLELAKKGCWISLDSVNPTTRSIEQYVSLISNFKRKGLLHKLLLSHDDGFAVIKSEDHVLFDAYKNGNSKPYASLSAVLKPQLLSQKTLSLEEYKMITTQNPLQAFKIEICAYVSTI